MYTRSRSAGIERLSDGYNYMKRNILTADTDVRIEKQFAEIKKEVFSSGGGEKLFFDEELQRMADEERFGPIEQPDEHLGMDLCFISSFITPEMRPAFHVFAREFLQKEPMLSDPSYKSCFQELLYPHREEASLKDAYDFRVLSMILLCAETGSDFSREILLSLYKTFYRKEYNVLKRMKSLPLGEALDAFIYSGEDEHEETREDIITARIFTMAGLMGIELDKMWNRAIQLLNDESLRNYALWKMIHISFLEKDIVENRREWEKESREWLSETFPDIGWVSMDDIDSDDERYSILEDIQNVIERAFDENGAGTGAVFGDRPFTLLREAAKAIRPEMFEETEDLEQIILFAVIRYLSASLARLITIRNSELNDLLGVDIRDLIEDEEMEDHIHRSLTNEESEQVRTVMQQGMRDPVIRDERTEKLLHSLSSMTPKQTVRKERKAQNGEAAPAHTDVGDEKDRTITLLQEQLSDAKQKLTMTEAEIRQQRVLYKESKEYEDTLEKQLEESRKEHNELVALRRFVHQMDSEDVDTEEQSDDEKLRELQGHSIAIIGGHENWIKKMCRILPEWTYIGARDSLSVDSAVTSVEKIYFYTDILSHSMYYKFLKAAQEKKRPFGYIHGTNLTVIVDTIYEDLQGSTGK